MMLHGRVPCSAVLLLASSYVQRSG